MATAGETQMMDIFVARLNYNAGLHGPNAANVTASVLFEMTSLSVQYAGGPAYATYANVSRALYGAGASTSIGGGLTYGVAAGTVAGIGAGLVVSAAMAAALGLTPAVIIGAGITAGLSSAAAAIIVQSAIESYEIYTGSPISAAWQLTYEDTVVLPPIIVEAEPTGFSPYDRAMKTLLARIEEYNNTYGIGLLLNDIFSVTNRNQGTELGFKIQGALPGAVAQNVVGQMEADINALLEAYENSPQEFKDANPELASVVSNLAKAIDGIGWALNIMSPIVLDLDGDGISTISIFDNDLAFDFGSGVAGHGWIGSSDGFLALDKNGNGNIDDINELFGGRETDGFTKLQEHDENQDGKIDGSDTVFSDLRVWVDANSNGQTDEGELHTLADLGITEISLDAKLQSEFSEGNWIPLSSTYKLESGEVREAADVYFFTTPGEDANASEMNPDSKVVIGTSQNDEMRGSSIDQVFFGGRGSDAFIFEKNSGDDVIVDFDTARDVVDISAWDVTPEALTISHTTEGTLVSSDQGSIHLFGVNDLLESNIVFHRMDEAA